MTGGLLSALAAAVLYGAGTILQSVGVRRSAAAEGEGVWARLRAGRLFGVGLAFDVVGFLASILALRTLPLFVVESALASSVAVTAALAVLFLGARLRRREVVALVAVGVGLVALAVSARVGAATALAGAAPWVLLGSVVPLLGLGVVAVRLGGSAGPALLAATAGLGFGGVGIAARVVVVPPALWRLLLDPVTWALVAFAVIAIPAYGAALQRGAVTTVAAVTFAVETVVPAAIGLLWLGDGIRPGAGAVATLGFVLTLAGSIALARHAAEEPAAVSG